MTAMKYYHISYIVPAKVGIHFDIDIDEWERMTDDDKVDFIRGRLRAADGELSNFEGGCCDAYIPDKKTVDLTALEIEEEVSDYWEPAVS